MENSGKAGEELGSIVCPIIKKSSDHEISGFGRRCNRGVGRRVGGIIYGEYRDAAAPLRCQHD